MKRKLEDGQEAAGSELKKVTTEDSETRRVIELLENFNIIEENTIEVHSMMEVDGTISKKCIRFV